jgi:hypothetical protein
VSGRIESWRVGDIGPPSQPGAIEQVSIIASSSGPASIVAHKYPSSFCGGDLAQCPNPFPF